MMNKKPFTLLSVVFAAAVFFSGLHMTPAIAADPGKTVNSLIAQMNNAVKKKAWNQAATYAKKIAVYYDDRKMYEPAAQYYALTDQYWTRYGKPDWGITSQIRGDHIRTVVDTYAEIPAVPGKKLEKFEPLTGMYVGMYPAGKPIKGSPAMAEQAFGKKHAIYLTYTRWRQTYPKTNSVFPVAYAEEIAKLGGAIQIGWEPMNGLDDVKDDEYVRQFAREAKASGIPVFLRYASEMNGEWVPWNGDPKKYIEKFRLIHDIMAEEAPNVTMVWSPNFLPRGNIDVYYPGDKYVDWVGFSLYIIPFSHGELKLGGNPIDYMKPLYDKYSKKPIMISEGAVSFYSYQLDKDYTKWGMGQLANYYAYMPRLLPQVKAMTYFDLDKRTTNYDNQNNNYDLHDRPEMLNTYIKLTSSPYFLTSVQDGAVPESAVTYKPLSQVRELSGKVKLFTYVKLPLGQQPYAVHLYDGKKLLLKRAYAPPFDMEVDFDQLPASGKLTVKVLDEKFRVLVTKEMPYQKSATVAFFGFQAMPSPL
ncbi:copper amine oxidase [Cohnella pontilimi]|uniref:Copper amine oxidase n=1 Tax=Cohnella pontilimi TaxID=2564100 RepID=A0A4U0F9V1_9BACL|nr:glycosyl hydrolase [Cohnella pontilimi]TJY41400.1 copper amine oxidase [Cohnella pontilimi]